MKPERWEKIISLAELAAELGKVERAAFLDEACAGDEPLRKEVESLLASDEQAQSFIEAPAFGIAVELIADDQVGSMVGEVVGVYKIVDLLGTGGMGEVYLALDTRLGRKVALKFLPSYFTSDKSRVRRFEKEARAASALNHPNILTVYDVGESAGRQFIATELVEGKTLRQHMENAQMTVGEVLDVAMQAASALAVAHQAGIVHRDIKPENIMVRPDGYIKVLDFGLAKTTEQRKLDSDGLLKSQSDTQTGLVMGTPHYMSPEQARGLKVDCRTDIFSLGVVIYEMLTSRKPFQGETTSHVIVAILEKDPPPISELSPDIPPDLERVINRALRKDTASRYQSVTDLMADLKSLRQLLETEEHPAYDPKDKKTVRTMRYRSTDGPNEKPTASSRDGRIEQKTLSAAYLISEIRQHKKSISLGLVAIIIAAASVAYFSPFESGKAIHSLAILPFTHAGSDPNLEYLSDGIADNLTNSLSRLPGLTVISSSAVSRHRIRDSQAQGPDVQAIGREFKVQAVVVGKVMQQGDSIHMNVELIDARDNSQLWGKRYDRKLADIFSLQEDITRSISEKLKLKLTGQEQSLQTKRYTENTEAYQAYLKGRYFWNKRTGEGVMKASEYFQQAIDLDPNYAQAYAGLADCYLFGHPPSLPPKVLATKAKEMAKKALEIDDRLGEAHASLGLIAQNLEWDWAQAEREYKRAIDLNPNYATAHQWYAEHLTLTGRFDEALEKMKLASDLDPLSLIIIKDTGEIYYAARKYDRAIEYYRKALEMDPGFVIAHRYLGMVYAQKGELSSAIAELQKARQLEDSPDGLSELGYVYALSGRRQEAQKVLSDLRLMSERRYTSPRAYALIYAGLGNRDKAFEWLERGYREGAVITELIVDPRWDNLRTDARFGDLMKRVGLTP